MLKKTILTTALMVCLTAVGATQAGAHRRGDRHCNPISTSHIKATHVIASSITCGSVKGVVYDYFLEVEATAQADGGCAQVRSKHGCQIDGYTCYSFSATYNTGYYGIEGVCKGLHGAVAWREKDIGPR
jgi:hypothetical protein